MGAGYSFTIPKSAVIFYVGIHFITGLPSEKRDIACTLIGCFHQENLLDFPSGGMGALNRCKSMDG